MSRYLINKFKGKYRVKSKYDLNTNDFPRDIEGNFECQNIYIPCKGNDEIWHWGGKKLFALINSKGRGLNILRKIDSLGKNDIILDTEITDVEVLIYFHVKDMDFMADFLGARTSGANISPFSVKNLPKKDKHKWNKYEPQDKILYDEMLKLLKEWIRTQGMALGVAYQEFYKEFGKIIKVDLVYLSREENYKPLHIIDKNGFTEAAIKWLNKNIK